MIANKLYDSIFNSEIDKKYKGKDQIEFVKELYEPYKDGKKLTFFDVFTGRTIDFEEGKISSRIADLVQLLSKIDE